MGVEQGETNSHAIQYRIHLARAAGLSPTMPCQMFQATWITTCLLKGGKVEGVQKIAALGFPRRTKLYDRRGDTITLDGVEGIGI